MMTSSTCALAVLLTVLVLGGQSAWADDLDAIRSGEPALTFAAGSIRQAIPQDGVVNVITGDNQTTGDRMQLGQYDTLYLKLKNPGDAAVGDLFTVFKRTRKVFHPMTNEYMGYLVTRLAIVEVIQVNKKLTTVKAVRAYGAVSPGDPVVKFTLPVESETGSRDASAGDLAGMIVEVQADMGLTLVAQRNVVYIDRGREDGLRAGNELAVIRAGSNLPPRVVGEIRILSTEDRTAAALITKSAARIFKGDRFRVKMQAAEALPVSQPIQQSQPFLEAPSPSKEAKTKVDIGAPRFQTQPASRETRITLDDLTRQLRYESGEARINPEGYQALDQLVEQLKTAPPDQLIRIEGHADNMEIGPSIKSQYPTNWDLSKARASGVLRYLVEKGGIDSARLSSIGYGDTKPVVSNATEAGRQKNRRVDIVLYSSEETTQAPFERSMNRIEAVNNGYRVSGLGSEHPKGTVPSEQAAVPAEPTQAPAESAVPGSIVNMPAAEPKVSDQPSGQRPGSTIVPPPE
jgi:chemotaxis protein MotB